MTHGAIAQLGERLDRTQEVAGSSPASSTALASRKPTPKLLSGGNPQIPKGYGDGPVQAYVAAVPGWKRDIVRRLDEIVTRTLPGVRKAVKYNSPLYGVEDAGAEGEGWFASIHCFTSYVRVTFFRGTSLDPIPPGESKIEGTRYLDVREGELDEAQFATWVEQAGKLPGERL